MSDLNRRPANHGKWSEWLLDFPPTLPFVDWLRRFPRLHDADRVSVSVWRYRSPLPGFIALLVVALATAMLVLGVLRVLT